VREVQAGIHGIHTARVTDDLRVNPNCMTWYANNAVMKDANVAKAPLQICFPVAHCDGQHRRVLVSSLWDVAGDAQGPHATSLRSSRCQKTVRSSRQAKEQCVSRGMATPDTQGRPRQMR
jgi:hypothetical protein